MQFDAYNGWPNYATWNAYTWLTSYQEIANQFEQIAYQYNQVQPTLTALLIDGIQRGFSHEAYHGIVTTTTALALNTTLGYTCVKLGEGTHVTYPVCFRSTC